MQLGDALFFQFEGGNPKIVLPDLRLHLNLQTSLLARMFASKLDFGSTKLLEIQLGFCNVDFAFQGMTNHDKNSSHDETRLKSND